MIFGICCLDFFHHLWFRSIRAIRNSDMWYWILRVILIFLLRPYFRLEVKGKHNIPKKTNFIIVANHASFVDPLVAIAAVPRKIYCVASRFLYKMWWISWFLILTETFPSGRSSIKALELVEKNRNVGLFPEGGCTRDGRLRKFRRGAALLALKTGRPILPCAILGTFRALPVTEYVPKPLKIKVKIGKPIYLLKEFDETIDDIYLQEGVFAMRNSIEEMIDAG